MHILFLSPFPIRNFVKSLQLSLGIKLDVLFCVYWNGCVLTRAWGASAWSEQLIPAAVRGIPAPAPGDNHGQRRPRDPTEQVKSLPTCSRDNSTAIRYWPYLLLTCLLQCQKRFSGFGMEQAFRMPLKYF